jgi:hypothetical protein
MTAAVMAVIVCAGLFGVAAPRLARILPPAWATRMLVPTSVAVTTAVWFALASAAFTWVGQQPEVAEIGPWSPRTLRADTPVGHLPAAAALALLAPATIWAVTTTLHRARSLLIVHRVHGRLGPPGALVVLDSDTPDAFTTPEARGRVVVTRGMLHALDGPERQALLAHERSHLVHRHAWWSIAIDVAAAANPLLTATRPAIRHAVERWADEDAARAVADRHLVARSVARAALARTRHARAHPTPAATGGEVADRVRALLDPPPPQRLPAIAVLAVLLSALAVSTSIIQSQGEHLFDRAGMVATSQR